MLGALIIGLATEISAAYITADYKYVIAFVALLVDARRAPDRAARRQGMSVRRGTR